MLGTQGLATGHALGTHGYGAFVGEGVPAAPPYPGAIGGAWGIDRMLEPVDEWLTESGLDRLISDTGTAMREKDDRDWKVFMVVVAFVLLMLVIALALSLYLEQKRKKELERRRQRLIKSE